LVTHSYCQLIKFILGRGEFQDFFSEGGKGIAFSERRREKKRFMKVEFLGGVRTVTGSATLLQKDSLLWLVDCGMFQGGRAIEERNRNVHPYHPGELSFILLTHAHLDHSGLIPKLVKEGFRGKVVCTKATFDLCEIILKDSGHIQEIEAEWQSRKNKRSGREDTARRKE
jgi:metallo-beta-lactamase family protein